MGNHKDGSGEIIHTVQAERDLKVNWEVDLAKKLEYYLLKICSGETRGTEENAAHISINFAEAALLLQGSVQVYSRKVEYLYSLVLHALDFLSEKRRQGQSDDVSAEQPYEKTASRSANDDEGDEFWGLDDIPVEPRNCLEASTSKDASFYHFTKPPANLVVLEADCLDTGGDGSELDSYLLATNDLYRDFILLDPCDAPSVNDFLNDGNGRTYKPTSVQKTIHSSAKRSRRSSLGKNQDVAFNRSPIPDRGLQDNNCDVGPSHSKEGNLGAGDQGFDMDDMCSPLGNLDDDSELDEENDPWKPLNPHEPGDLKVKPFNRVALRRNTGNLTNSSRQTSISALFPVAKLHGPISTEFKEMWEVHRKTRDQLGNSRLQSNHLYEKLRESLAGGGKKTWNSNDNAESDNWDNDDDNGDPGFGQPYGEMPEATFMDEGLSHQHNKDFDGATRFDTNDCFEQGEPSSQASLEDLCRSHLDALLANISESEKQTELAARVSSWKQKIEHNLEVQDSRPPFDIHVYGKRILDKLSLESDTDTVKSFADIVMGQEKHDVARSFSAMLQLVNNGDIDLEKNAAANGNSFCYTAVNPFHVKLLKKDGRQAQRNFKFSKKRVKSPLVKPQNKEGEKKLSRDRSPTPNSRVNCMLGLLFRARSALDEASLLPPLSTWQTSEDVAQKIMYSIECEMRRCPYTLGLSEPNLAGKSNLDYDAVCKPAELHRLLKRNPYDLQIENQENQALYTVHQILESWIQVAKQVIGRLTERIAAEEFESAANDCYFVEQIWKLLAEIEDLHLLMDPDDFLKLKDQLSIRSATETEPFCFRSRSLVEITRACKELKHKVPEILAVEVDPKGGPRIQEAAMRLYREKSDWDKIHSLQAVEAVLKKFFYAYKQVLAAVMGSLEAKGNSAVVAEVPGEIPREKKRRGETE